MPTIFFTGFPGFLGSELLPRVLTRRLAVSHDANAVCVVQDRYLDLAHRRAAELSTRFPEVHGRVRIVAGDITQPGLGMANAVALQREIVEIYHLAAVYDLSVERSFAMRVNVEGTRHVLDFAEGCSSLAQFQYVSTCYVSGAFAGVFREEDLERGQRFNNFYEETKYLAEVEVRRRMAAGLPAAIYRPSIVVGDSRSGATQKYDGPYFMIQLLLRQLPLAFAPVSGDPTRTEFNVVPRDFVVSAITFLSGRPESIGKTYQLADPRPLTFDQLVREIARATGRTLIRVPLPLGLAKWSLDHVPGVYRLFKIPSSALDYQVHPARYDTTHASRDLAESGVVCPEFPSYVGALVRYFKAHPEIEAAPMV